MNQIKFKDDQTYQAEYVILRRHKIDLNKIIFPKENWKINC